MTETTAKKLPAHLNPDVQFKPGQSGNPAGRPRGSRNELGEAFIADLVADWKASSAGRNARTDSTRECGNNGSRAQVR